MLIKKFEDVQAWQKARELTRKIYELTGHEPFAKDFGLRDQIQRAAVSVMSNIAEGFDRTSNREKIRFIQYAKSSATEVQSDLYVALDIGHIDQSAFIETYQLAADTIGLIGGFIRYLKKTDS